MLAGKKICVVLPAYNAAATVERTVAEIDRAVVDDIILVDDASRDDTATLAASLGLYTLRRLRNGGYGANQKTCYAAALDRGADVVIMLHPDYQYTPRLVVPIAGMVASGVYGMVLASRILGRGALAGGMPWWKYIANRVLTLAENVLLGTKLSEYHTGYRAFSREVLESVNLDADADGFVFDNQMIAQALAAGCRIGEISCPTRYADDSSSVGFAASVRYGFGVLRTAIQFRLHTWGIVRYKYLQPPEAGSWRSPLLPQVVEVRIGE